MTLLRLRRCARVVAVVLLVASARGAPHFAQDDFACAPDSAAHYLEHDETQHGLRAAGPAHEQEHCAVCHWTRSLRSPLALLAGATGDEDRPAAVHGAAVRAPLAPALDSLPARAPPPLR